MILVRHGQTVFNLHFGASRIDPGIEDPGLTETGREQAHDAARLLGEQDLRELVVSPYRRTLETAAIIADRLRIPIRIEPLVRERFGYSCDVGTVRTELRLLWPEHDFSHLTERWWHARDEPHPDFAERCEAFRNAVAKEAGWRHVAVVTHWGVIRALTGRIVANGEIVRFDPVRCTEEAV